MISSEPVVQSNDLWRGVHWFAIYAKPRRENFGATNLSALGIEILFPPIKFERLLRGTSKRGPSPCFQVTFLRDFVLEIILSQSRRCEVCCRSSVPAEFRSRYRNETAPAPLCGACLNLTRTIQQCGRCSSRIVTQSRFDWYAYLPARKFCPKLV
jgi:hypothetical protein